MPCAERLGRLAHTCRRHDFRAADLERIAQQFARMRIVVDDEQLQFPVYVRFHLVSAGRAFGSRTALNMQATKLLHDSDPYDGRLLDELLQAGVLMLDGKQRCCFASPRACAHFGASDEAALLASWDELRAGLDLPDVAALGVGDPPLQRRSDLLTPSGTRKLRFEVHAVNGGGARYMMLLRDRTAMDGAERAQVMASECTANRHVIASLVHDAKGPLNNLHLTLALLTSTIGRMNAAHDQQDALARCQRYLDVMQTEETRLAARLNDIHALTQRFDVTCERVDVGVLLRDVARLLRHEARIRDAKLELDVATGPAWTFGDPHQLQLAFLAFCECLVDAARPASVITLRVSADTQSGAPRVRLIGTSVAMPVGVTAHLFRISATPDTDAQAVLAGRMIIEAHGGDVTLVGEDAASGGFAIGLPCAPATTIGST